MKIAFHLCPVPDVWCGDAYGHEAMWCIAQCQAQEDEESEHFRGLDMANRLTGDCERCQEPQPDLLTAVGGEAICDDCMMSEVAGAANSAAYEPPPETDVWF